MTAPLTRAVAIAAASGLALGGAMLLAPSASAKDGDVRLRGACTAPSTSALAVKIRVKDGQLRTDFWVKSEQAGQAWSFTLTQAGNLMAEGIRTTTLGDDSDDDSRSGRTVTLRDRGSDDDNPSGDDLGDDNGGDRDDDDRVDDNPSVDDLGDDSRSPAAGQSSTPRPAELKIRTWIPNVPGDLVFTATFEGQTCTITVPRPA